VIKPEFDDFIHAPTRLSIVSLLAAADWVEFKFLRQSLDLSDSAQSKQLTALEQAGYIDIKKDFVLERPRTRAPLSHAGRAAFLAHVAALEKILGGPRSAPSAHVR